MMGNPVFVDTMTRWRSGVMMSFSELYSARRPRRRRAENNPPSLLTQNHYQVTNSTP